MTSLTDLQNPNPNSPDKIQRTQRATSQPSHLSRFPQISLSQGATEQILLDYLDVKAKVHVERSLLLESLQVNDAECEDTDAYPVTLTLRKLASNAKAADAAGDGELTSI